MSKFLRTFIHKSTLSKYPKRGVRSCSLVQLEGSTGHGMEVEIMLADLRGGYKASPPGRVHRRSSLSRSDDVVCHNFTSDRIKGAAARPSRKILLLAHEHRSCSRKSRVPPPLLRSGGQPCAPRLQVHRCTLEPLWAMLPHGPRNGARTTDLTPRFLQFGFLENQCAVPIVRPSPLEEKSRH